MNRNTQVLVLATSLMALWLGLPGFSSATYTSTSRNVASVGAAVDWTPPTVALQHPGSPVKGNVTLTATASDAETGVQRVTIEFLPVDGSSWTPVCTATAAPYTCTWNTSALADGAYDLRARATDDAGYAATSAVVRTTVANALLVVLSDPGDVVRGTVPLSATLFNAGSVSYSVKVEYSPAGANSWKSICSNLAAPYSCSWNTAAFAGDYYDLRAVAAAGGTSSTSAVVSDVLVDNVAPTVTMVDPGTPLSGTRTFAATAADAGSGIAQVVLQYAAAGSSAYKVLCTVATAPYSCRVDTTSLADGAYSFRAVATDVAGNSSTSAAVANRVVDNTISSVSVEDPGAFLSGAVNLVAVASSTAGVTSVRIQVAPSGSGAWVDVCTDPSAPYSCAWDTTKVTDGLYDLRAVLLDGAGRTTVSAVEATRRVDNSPLRAVDVQTVGGGASAGRLDNGDSVVLTYSEQVDLATLTAGWTGGALPVTLRLRDGNLLGLGNKGDTVDILRNGTPVAALGSVNLKEDYVKSNKSSVFNATMTASTTVVAGVTRTVVTVRVGTLVSGGSLRTVSTPSTMVWTPSAAATDLSGNACSTAPATESGTLDREF